MPNEPRKKRTGAGEVVRLYSKRILERPVLFAGVIIGGLLFQGANIAAPLYLRQFFNVLAGAAPGDAVVGQLFAILGAIALLWFLRWGASRAQDVCNMFLQSRIMADLFADSFDYLLGHSYNFFISNFSGSLTHRISKFARAFETITDSILIQFLPTFYFVAGAVFILSLRNGWLGLALGLWCIAFIGFQIWSSRKRQPLREARAEADTRVTGALADAVSNHATIMLFSGRAHEHGLFKAVVHAWHDITLRLWLADAWIWSGIGLFIIVIETGLLGGGVLLWRQGLFTIGDFVLVQSYLLVTFDRLLGINRELRRFYDAFADAREMAYILKLPYEVADAPGAAPLKTSRGEIVFDDVDFHFHAERSILQKFSLRIDGGTKIALVGPSGAGKSTITKLLLRMYDVEGGSIRIDGQNIAEVTQDSLRAHISFVPQEPVLFHRTLMENIRYGRRDATDAEVIEAARQAHCHEFITALPLQYETYVGERGIKLSGGERQRVAIARAILKNSPILVLDEATSSLDSESESLIQDALEVLMRGKTVITVAHRLSTIMKMDRIIVMEHGTIAAQGTHLELLRQRGLYKKLWSIQAGGFIGGEEKVPPHSARTEEEAAAVYAEEGEVKSS